MPRTFLVTAASASPAISSSSASTSLDGARQRVGSRAIAQRASTLHPSVSGRSARALFLSGLLVIITAQRGPAVEPTAGQSTPGEQAAAEAFFEKKIRPLLAENCYNCHSASTNSQGGLRIDDRGGLLSGGERGPAIVPGHARRSLLIRAVSQTDDELKMPPKKQLSAEQIADLTKWIKRRHGLAGHARARRHE